MTILNGTDLLPPLSTADFFDILNSLDLSGFITIKKAHKYRHDAKDRRVFINVDASKTIASIEKIGILREILGE